MSGNEESLEQWLERQNAVFTPHLPTIYSSEESSVSPETYFTNISQRNRGIEPRSISDQSIYSPHTPPSENEEETQITAQWLSILQSLEKHLDWRAHQYIIKEKLRSPNCMEKLGNEYSTDTKNDIIMRFNLLMKEAVLRAKEETNIKTWRDVKIISNIFRRYLVIIGYKKSLDGFSDNKGCGFEDGKGGWKYTRMMAEMNIKFLENRKNDTDKPLSVFNWTLTNGIIYPVFVPGVGKKRKTRGKKRKTRGKKRKTRGKKKKPGKTRGKKKKPGKTRGKKKKINTSN